VVTSIRSWLRGLGMLGMLGGRLVFDGHLVHRLLDGRVVVDFWLDHGGWVILNRFMNNRCLFHDGFVDLRWGGLNFELLLNFWIIDLILLIHDLIFKLLRDFMVVDNNVVILFWGWRRITLFAHAETEPIRAISFILRQQKSQELVVLSSIPLVDLSEAVIKLNPVDSEGLEIVTSLWVTKSTSVEEGNSHGVDVGFEGVVLRLEDALLELIEELGRGVRRLGLP